ncbi:hypothetical protein [Alistipes sp.]|uniref:hypothetical protein n=1 Tax=Alistipes sp. TaxID=1872444 RepID=UPI0025C128D8|nr:hypothetical protein [Alistipes sp.]
MIFSQLSKIVEPKVISVFEEVGFELDKKITRKWLRHYNDNIDFVIGLNTSGRGCHFYGVNPILDVYMYDYRRIFHEITGKPQDKCPIPFVWEPLGYTTPRQTFYEWKFTADNIEEKLSELRFDLKEHGIPFMYRVLNIKSYVEKHKKAGDVYARYFVPIMYAQLGEKDKANVSLEKYYEEYRNRPEWFTIFDYDKFCRLVKQYYDL